MVKKVLLLFVVIVIIIILALTLFVKLPPGFVPLNSNLKNGLTYMIWETQITFLDADEEGIYQTELNNKDFIVRYKGEYYVNEEKLLELIDIAAISPEQSRKTYNLGDDVVIRGAGKTEYTVKIISLETGETEHYGLDETLTTYYIKYAVSSNVAENNLIGLFIVETEYDVQYNDLNFIDAETFSVKIRSRGSDKIKAIVASSPDYPGLIYRILVNE